MCYLLLSQSVLSCSLTLDWTIAHDKVGFRVLRWIHHSLSHAWGEEFNNSENQKKGSKEHKKLGNSVGKPSTQRNCSGLELSYQNFTWICLDRGRYTRHSASFTFESLTVITHSPLT